MTSSDPTLTANLITGRTGEPGVAIEGWKDKQEYVDVTGLVQVGRESDRLESNGR
jgi:hypothetical protein